MASSTTIADALGELDSELGRLGSIWLTDAPPGLSTAEVQEIAGRAGLSFPSELAALWQWHAGPPPANLAHFQNDLCLPGAFEFYSMDEVVDRHLEALAGEILDDSRSMKTTWAPALAEYGRREYWADTGVGIDDPVPLTPAWLDDPLDDEASARRYRIDSITELVRDMTRMLREGHWGRFNLGPDGMEVWGWNPDLSDASVHYPWAESWT